MDYKQLLDAKVKITGHNSNTDRYLNDTRQLRDQLTDLRDKLTRDIDELNQVESVLTKLNRVHSAVVSDHVGDNGNETSSGQTLGETGLPTSFDLNDLEHQLSNIEAEPKPESETGNAA